ncbi:hypothetical protein NEAUS05_1966 [Nematocida ausubeli]|nr:hypothetical protein NEAUS07_0405 [Nematocida ausubeli]KAI5134840.1 hypothetical protein NEAUS06_1341 [Nematocida ausubeli]KAI5149931.1 hypothetical protein NEAUS05_1966 [Nematocida ausubeli]
MHGKSSEVQSPTKNSKNTQTVKGTQGTKPPEGFILTNTALNTYVYEYLKSPTEETYSLLESINAPLAEEIKYKKPKMNRKNKTVLNSLVGSLIDTVDLSTIEILDEEKRNRRISNKFEHPQSINDGLMNILSSIVDESETKNSQQAENYFELLKKVEKMNRSNKEKIIQAKSEYLGHSFYYSLLEKIDNNIETLFKKIKKKKKKEDDTNYCQELEDLLEKRNRFKTICKDIPSEMEEIKEAPPIGIESIESVLSEAELEAIKDLLPTPYLETWLN